MKVLQEMVDGEYYLEILLTKKEIEKILHYDMVSNDTLLDGIPSCISLRLNCEEASAINQIEE